MNRYCPKLFLSCLDFENKLSNTLEPALCSYGSTECFSLWACTFIELNIYLFIYFDEKWKLICMNFELSLKKITKFKLDKIIKLQ